MSFIKELKGMAKSNTNTLPKVHKVFDKNKISPNNLTLDFTKNYLRIEHDLDDAEIQVYIAAAISFVRNYTKQKTGDLDDELLIPILALVGHFYESKGTTMKSNEKADYIFNMIMESQRGDIL